MGRLMELEERTVVTYFTPDGFERLSPLLDLTNEQQGTDGLVSGTDVFGIWLSPKERPRRMIIIPWHYIRAIEFELEGEPGREVTKHIGL